MNSPLKNIKDEADKIRLSSHEKEAIRAYLLETMRRTAPAVSQAPTRALPTPYFFFAPRYAMVFAVFLILILGTTTTYAAKGALPGSPLYPVKIYINENVQGALAVSDQAKISYHSAVAEERLKEAEALANQGKLDATTSAQIEENFNEHVAEVDTIATDLENRDPIGGVEAKIALNSSLSAHSSILSHIGEVSSNKETKENSQAIASRARSHGEEGGIVALRAAAPSTMSFSATGEASGTATSSTSTEDKAHPKAKTNAPLAAATTTAEKNVATQFEKIATMQLNKAHATFNDNVSMFDASTTQKIHTQLSQLDTQLASGTEQLKKTNYLAARATFSNVFKASIELNAFIEASKTYKRDLIRSWNDDREGSQDNSNSEGNSDHHESDIESGLKVDLHL